VAREIYAQRLQDISDGLQREVGRHIDTLVGSCRQPNEPCNYAPPATTTTAATAPTLAPPTTTVSGTVPDCNYNIRPKKFVNTQDTGGDKLELASYTSFTAYLNACKAQCNRDPSCRAFNDDNGSTGRSCTPRTASEGYATTILSSDYQSNPSVTAYVKFVSSGC